MIWIRIVFEAQVCERFQAMTTEVSGAQKHFDKVPKQWDAFYSHENRFIYLINKLLRKGLYERYRLTFEYCGNLSGVRVLDVGCGTGRYSIECAKRGASRVLGIDFAPSMIKFSQEIAEQMNVSDKCEFICDDLTTHKFEEVFDIVLSLGFFDYIEKPEEIFHKISQLKPRVFVASFPTFTPVWGIQRAIRYRFIKKCPIYYYTRDRLKQLYQEAGFSHCEIIRLQRGFFCAAGTHR